MKTVLSNCSLGLVVTSLLGLHIAGCDPDEPPPKGSSSASGGDSSSSNSSTSSSASSSASSSSSSGNGGSGGASSSSSSSGNGGSGGASSSSSSSGTGGNGGSMPVVTLIDDMELNTGSLPGYAGTQGAWLIFNDMSPGANQWPIANNAIPFEMSMPGAGFSSYAARTYGSGFTTWGAGFGFDLANPAGPAPAGPYDAAMSGFKGITFKAKVGIGAYPKVALKIGDINTVVEGGKCNPAATMGQPNRCGDYWGTTLTLTEEWQDYTITFATLKQEGWGMNGVSSVAASALWFIHWQVGPNAPKFDIWIDDVGFYK